MSYYIHDISDTDRIYQFKKEQLENVDCMEMINLHDRGATSEYTLPMDMQKGKQLTIINRDFGVDYDDYYCGVEIVLNLDRKQDRASYFFYFKNQSASFVFNGSFWIPLFPKPHLNVYMNVTEDMMEYGYLNIEDYNHRDRRELFGNVDISKLKKDLQGTFFRNLENPKDFGKIQKASIKEHNHTLEEHEHQIQMAQYIDTNVSDNLQSILEAIPLVFDLTVLWKWFTGEAEYALVMLSTRYLWVSNWLIDIYFKNSAQTTNDLSLRIVKKNAPIKSLYAAPELEKTGDKETLPQYIEGKYIIKAF